MCFEYYYVDYFVHDFMKEKGITKEVRVSSIIFNIVRITVVIGSSVLYKGRYKF